MPTQAPPRSEMRGYLVPVPFLPPGTRADIGYWSLKGRYRKRCVNYFTLRRQIDASGRLGRAEAQEPPSSDTHSKLAARSHGRLLSNGRPHHDGRVLLTRRAHFEFDGF